MKLLFITVSMFISMILTSVASAHPGHAEGNPLAHDVEHFFILLSGSGLLLLIGMIAFFIFNDNKK